MRIYLVYEGNRDTQLAGVFDRKGLKAYLKRHRNNCTYSHNYTVDGSGVKKYDGRYKIPKTNISVISFPLNESNYGREIEWRTFK